MVILIQLKDTVLHKVSILLLSKKKRKKKYLISLIAISYCLPLSTFPGGKTHFITGCLFTGASDMHK